MCDGENIIRYTVTPRPCVMAKWYEGLYTYWKCSGKFGLIRCASTSCLMHTIWVIPSFCKDWSWKYKLKLAMVMHIYNNISLLSRGLINPNLPDPVNFVPFGMMKYSFFFFFFFLQSTSFIFMNILCIWFACLFLNKVSTFLCPMIYDLPWITIILTFCYQIHNFNTENPQNEVGKLEFNTCLIVQRSCLIFSTIPYFNYQSWQWFFSFIQEHSTYYQEVHILCIPSWILGVPSSYLKHLFYNSLSLRPMAGWG